MNLADVQKPWLPEAVIHRHADNLRLQHFPDGKIPVDVLLLVEDMGIHLVPIPFLQQETGAPGCIAMNEDEILVDQDVLMKPNRENYLRFTVAHELGHKILHDNLITFLREQAEGSVQRWNDLMVEYQRHDLAENFEWQANEFAGHFLVPPHALAFALQPFLESLRQDAVRASVFTVEQIAAFLAPRLNGRFQVSQEVMQIRMSKEPMIRALFT